VPNIGIGRRIVRMFAGALSLGTVFYWLGTVVVTAVPALPPTTPLLGLAVGASSAVLVELSADIEAIATKEKE